MSTIPSRVKNITGQLFGRITVLSFRDIHKRRTRWYCVCSCGEKLTCSGSALKTGNTRSCGCLKRDTTIERNITQSTTHGMTATSIYNVWASMKRRCCRPSSQDYKNYGGRGITVCERWLEFENFYEDMGDRPSNQYSIERIDNDGDYCLDNCKWILTSNQAKNRRTNRRLSYNGETRIVVDWARHLNMNVHTIYSRLNRGWSIADTLTRPLQSR
jgi:hypothetical protein